MKTNALRKRIRDAIVARNTLENMAKSTHSRNVFGQQYLNRLAIDVMKVARRAHPLMPYYLATRRV